MIDVEVRNLIAMCRSKTMILLKTKKDLVENLAKLLMEKERVVNEDLHKVLGPRPFPHKEGYARYLHFQEDDLQRKQENIQDEGEEENEESPEETKQETHVGE